MTEKELNKKIETWLYFLVKNAARQSYNDFLKDCDISKEEYEQIKIKISETFNCKLYV